MQNTNMAENVNEETIKSEKAVQLRSATYENAPSTSAPRLLPEYRSGLGEQVRRRGLSRAWQWKCRLLHTHVPKPTCLRPPELPATRVTWLLLNQLFAQLQLIYIPRTMEVIGRSLPSIHPVKILQSYD